MEKIRDAKVVLRNSEGSFDKLLMAAIVGLTLFGLLMLTDASLIQAQNSFGDKFFFVKGQAVAAIIGLFAFFASIFIPLSFWEKIAFPAFLLTILLLVFVFIPSLGVEALGARRWIGLGEITFQPSEVAKLTAILYFARILGKGGKLLTFFLTAFVVIGLIVAEPDFGTASTISATIFIMLFMSGVPIALFTILLPTIIALGGILILTSSYRKERLLTFLGQTSDPISSSYHISQVLIALSFGGIFGVGFGQSRSKYLFLPEAATDSIFAVIAEEFGFVGVAILIGFFVFIISRMFRIATRTNSVFGKLTAAGIATWIGAQTFVNMAAMTATVPITGIPLPFISYGGTALVVTLVASGIVLGISRTQRVVRGGS